jgi:cyclic pyranopterin phosphate synthase
LSELTHFDDRGASRMVDVGEKPITRRAARASAKLRMGEATLRTIMERRVGKGDVLQVARLAGILAAKKTSELIPMCHPLALDAVSVDFRVLDSERMEVESVVSVTARTGVEMEALVAASVAALTIYDMCKSIDRGMQVEWIRLEEKSGGRTGRYERGPLDAPFGGADRADRSAEA